MIASRSFIAFGIAALAGCTEAPVGNDAVPAKANTAAEFSWPASLRVVGDGFPTAGSPCRRIGESAATVDYLDDSATLAGCPTAEQAAALGGRVVGTVDGVTLVSVPNAGASTAEQPDAKVAGTNYNATADIPCSGTGGAPTCKAGVVRGADQISIDIKLPSSATRTLLFDGKGKFVTHASAQADGSAALRSSATREDDWTIVSVGAERYRIPDAFVLGD